MCYEILLKRGKTILRFIILNKKDDLTVIQNCDELVNKSRNILYCIFINIYISEIWFCNEHETEKT